VLLIAVIVALALLAVSVSWGSATGSRGTGAMDRRRRPTSEPSPPNGRTA
jgi:hypothetical protein